MAQIVAYDTAFGAADPGEERPDQRAHAAMQGLRNIDDLQEQTYLYHIVAYTVDIQPDINWVQLWWLPDVDAFWRRLAQERRWIVLGDYLSENRDMDAWPPAAGPVPS